MRQHKLTLFADYFQFYLRDEAADGDLRDAWDEGAIARFLATTGGTIGIGTVRNRDVPVEVQIHDGPPDLDLSPWDHVNECTVDVSSGRLVVAGCTDYEPDAARIEVSPGVYRARILYGSLDSLSQDGLDGNDHYVVQLWPGGEGEILVLKQRPA